ncbi:Branched-chain amino acid transport protein [Paramaledivibacter caminithermalis DSM 15212]|uniref:Branched-chain amino acid transport protein n=2 Tax=Paramaledivibacter TaxID=1884934 RepID=A0A1M6TDC4_PARC5|nr:Branched-chain amino acid transport protein [Paramaledivibacter caminithermalis DSM 15212]
MNIYSFIIMLIGMGIVTYIPRCVPLLFLAKHRKSEKLNKWLQYIPVAIFSALIFPDIFIKNQQLVLLDVKILISLVVFVVALKSKSIGISIMTGLGMFYFLGR